MTQLVLSVFPGIGLLDRAFEEEGFAIVRGPDLLWGGDIRRFHPPAGRFDGLIGGPPCQAFSTLVHLVRATGGTVAPNLIPEFERCVAEAQPDWFLMENVPAAPIPSAPGYAVCSFTVGNEAIAADDGLGQEQERLCRFSFGVRGGRRPVDLRRWIRLAALLLPRRSAAVTTTHVDNTAEAKGRWGAVVHTPPPGQRVRHLTQAVTSRAEAVPVAIGGSGRRKPGARVPTVVGAHSGHLIYRLEDMLRLQGLPPDFLAHAPFTVKAKRRAIANGVPLPLGLAVARAVREAVAEYVSGATA